MIHFADSHPDVQVQPDEYARLLGYPRGKPLEGRVGELADWSRAWYTVHGHPWVCAKPADAFEIAGETISIDGARFHSTRLQSMLQQAGAHSAILVAVGAGGELEEEARKVWEEGKPDEYFFLEMFGSAVVEHLITTTGARLCAWAETRGMAVLPHYSPGYPAWDLAEQARLLVLMRQAGPQAMPYPLQVLESGMLEPKKSLLAVFGLTRHTDRLRKLSELVPCESCSFRACQYRRAPYRWDAASLPAEPPCEDAGYSVNRKALERWTAERLSLERAEDGTIDALFRYEGTTCTNTGRPIQFHYAVKLGAPEDGYPIQSQRCAPAPEDTGHAYMCRYQNNAEHLMTSIDRERPLAGRPLSDVLSWRRAECAAGCYCEPSSREHKWGLVLETIHYALAREQGKPRAPR